MKIFFFVTLIVLNPRKVEKKKEVMSLTYISCTCGLPTAEEKSEISSILSNDSHESSATCN